MIKRDSYGLIVDDTGDGGDSANRAGLLYLCTGEYQGLLNYSLNHPIPRWGSLKLVRHPFQVPWNNPKNFSRDQLIPYVAGLWRQEEYKIVEKILWGHIKRFGFCQNFERDAPKSIKRPWPHSFINDRGEREERVFDFADPLFPNDFWHLILCARAWYLYWFAPIGYAWLLLSLAIHCMVDDGDDEGQIISQCIVAGPWFVRLYRRFRTRWEDRLWQYWRVRRNQIEIYAALTKTIKGY